MSRRINIIAAAALAIVGLPPSCVTPMARAADSPPTVNGSVASDPRDQHNELHGVRMLFSQAANAVMADNGVDQVAGLFVAETAGGHALREAAPANSAISGTTVAPAAPSDHSASVRRFASAWHAKYHDDFRISDETVVFGDITSDDLRRSHRDTRLQLTPPATQPAAAGAVRVNPAVPAGTPGADNTNSVSNPNNQRTASGTIIPRTDPESLKPLSQIMVVHVPGVAGAVAIDIRLMREGPADFRFVSTGQVDLASLGIDIDRHLAAVMVDETKWPADIHQAQRIVAQQLFLAVADYQASLSATSAGPAAAHLPATPTTPAADTSVNPARPGER